MDLARATWPQVEATGGHGVLAVPLGSLEQHGPHLPLDTDTRIAVAVAEGLAGHCGGVAVAPAVAYGASGEHAAFPGTLVVGHEVLAGLLVELVRSARSSFSGVVLVSAHGGNEEALSLVQARCAAEGDDVVVWRLRAAGGDAHAGRTETSLMLAIDPAAVRLELAEAGCTEPLDGLLPRLRAEGVRPVSSNGVLGDPAGASADEGRALLDTLVRDLAASRGGALARPVSPAAVVTGAARGIGAATVDALVAAGWQVVAVDRCADDPALDYPLAAKSDLEEVAARHGAAVRTVVGDVRSASDMRAAVDEALRQFGGLQAAVAVAGVISGGPPLWETADAQWDALFDVNVNGVRHLAAAAVPALLEAPEPRQGRFVAVASAAGLLGLRRLAAYSASKHAVIGLVRSLAADLAGTGVTANAVCPGSTRGPMLDASAAVYGLSSPEEFAVHQLVERLLEPAEPAALIAWLCGPDSGGVTGAALPVDGGMTTS